MAGRKFFALLLLLNSVPLFAATLSVPEIYPTVQEAIDAADEGDIVDIAPGVYEESLVLRGGITIAGRGELPEDVALEGLIEHPIAELRDDTRLLILKNMRLRNGFAVHGGGLYLENARVKLDRVEFWGCGSMLEGGAIFARNVDLEAEFCVFFLNYSWGADGAALFVEGQGPLGEGQKFQNCTFAGTSLCCGNASIYMLATSPLISNCILELMRCGAGAFPYLTCNNGEFCGIDGGGHIPGGAFFCNLYEGELHLRDESFCLPQNSGGCGLIGALGQCLDQSATESISFSLLKTLY
jgi:hypothetical protein